MRRGSARGRGQAGITLIELLLAVTLFGAISASMGLVLNVAFTSLNKIDNKVDLNRRIISSQRTLDLVLRGLIPVVAPCAGQPVGFSGRPGSVVFASSHSLTEGARGRPKVVTLFSAESPNGGVRLLLNEQPYFGRQSLTAACVMSPQVLQNSFVLADRLGRCSFSYCRRDLANGAEVWNGSWAFPEWPIGISIQMAPLKATPNQIQPTTVFAPLLVMNYNFDEIPQ